MKGTNYLLSGLLWLLVLSLAACNSENEEDILPEGEICQENTATLSGVVSTIIETNCAVSGCHVTGTGRVDFTVNENIIQNAAQIELYPGRHNAPSRIGGGSHRAGKNGYPLLGGEWRTG